MSDLRIATRGSELALWQASLVRDALLAREPDLEIELRVVKTRGDLILDRPLAEIGGKALFVKEIEQALLNREADLAVHSMKDVPADLAPGLELAAISKRADPRDALCSRGGLVLDALPRGAHLGTSSLRRVCQLRAHRPDLWVSPLRGNVSTRLERLDEGAFDAIVLAAAGLERLGHGQRISERLDPALCLPAVGQGALAVEARARDAAMISRARAAVHSETDGAAVAAERAFLARLGGSCQTPLAAWARLADGGLKMSGMVGLADGSRLLRAEGVAAIEDAVSLGREVAEELLGQGAQTIIDALR